ncbi:SIS domain-containing protein [Paludibacterium purpuratum]|uniref:Tagatose-6-phosphate ketose/aldose isomerase n=1 Tax=Paludibacterium purpuratum TaxID=1144873 RepID=A0A4R7AYV4_9NEIS|nr:SIS domain-containing protein [Paludibacterium purpuratum]TDR73289.1 tagatose-6-phosphate ketose/aldose isomerase [Paludibacterium purpuratum]
MNPVFAEFDRPAQQALHAAHTMPEILGQPDLWLATWQCLMEAARPLNDFLMLALADRGREIVLTGAGSSAFIGELLQGAFARKTGRAVRAVPTTDIVTHPDECFAHDAPTLLISFARSGSSPESVAALERADACLSDVMHLIITCNAEGELAQYSSRHPVYVLTLPTAANDKGLAMTGSFTAMSLAGWLLCDPRGLPRAEARVELLADTARLILHEQGEVLRHIAELDFHRAVVLGAGPLRGAARESHLKMQELTNGAVMCSYDSFLGFRHGPKAVIDEHTLLIFLFSSRPDLRAYEQDLVREIAAGSVPGLFHLGVGDGLIARSSSSATLSLGAGAGLADEERAICSVLPAQVLGVYRALALGLSPDNPSPSGSISRVVRGVTIYPCEQRPAERLGECS